MEQLQSLSLSFKCGKAFDTLQPCDGGWYCNGCQKLVHDLRGRPEQEICDILAANNYKLCGMFEADRIRVNESLPMWRKWAAAAVLALGFISIHQALMAQQTPAKKPSTDSTLIGSEIFGSVEESAQYPGGIDKWYKYLKSNVKVDGSCRPGDKAFVTFIVEKDGSLSGIEMLHSPFSSEVNDRIIDLIKKSKKWWPGMRFGRAIKQQYTLPIELVAK